MLFWDNTYTIKKHKGGNAVKIGIVGLGLMGGSLALEIKDIYKDSHILGLDHNKSHQQEALSLGIIDELVTDINELNNVDILILSVPVDGIIAILQNLKDINQNMTIIDLGSTKSKIINSIPQEIRANFVAAHPLTGTEKSGPTAAIKNLYNNKVVVLCNIQDSGALQKQTALSLFEALDMNIVYMDAKEHDKHTAQISHMPHALSFALANCVLSQENPESIVALAGGGFKDMSRIAKSSPKMWEDVFRQNSDHIVKTIDMLNDELQLCKTMIKEEKWQELNDWMKSANKLHEIL